MEEKEFAGRGKWKQEKRLVKYYKIQYNYVKI